jgi:DNA-binding phage protein
MPDAPSLTARWADAQTARTDAAYQEAAAVEAALLAAGGLVRRAQGLLGASRGDMARVLRRCPELSAAARRLRAESGYVRGNPTFSGIVPVCHATGQNGT